MMLCGIHNHFHIFKSLKDELKVYSFENLEKKAILIMSLIFIE